MNQPEKNPKIVARFTCRVEESDFCVPRFSVNGLLCGFRFKVKCPDAGLESPLLMLWGGKSTELRSPLLQGPPKFV